VLALSWVLVYIRDIKREEPQMAITEQISTLAKVSIDQAAEIHDVLLTEALIDFSEATTRQFKQAINLATWFIDNGRSWE